MTGIPPGYVRLQETRSVLGDDGVDARICLKTGEVIFARVVMPMFGARTRCVVRPWGCKATRTIRLAEIAGATLARVNRWSEVHRIADEQWRRFTR